jgi:hypothetical protein
MAAARLRLILAITALLAEVERFLAKSVWRGGNARHRLSARNQLLLAVTFRSVPF